MGAAPERLPGGRRGRALLFYGADTALQNTPSWSMESNQPGARFGHAVALGDTNNDGFAEIIVGAPSYSNGEPGEGVVVHTYATSGTYSGIGGEKVLQANSAGGQFGAAVATADLNGDNFADVIVGAPKVSGGILGVGGVYAYYGGEGALSTKPSWLSYSGAGTNIGFGAAAAGAGDVNGDGFGDLLVGAPLYNGGQAAEGRVRFYYGGGGPGRSMLLRQRNTGGPPLHPGGSTRLLTSYQVRAGALSPFGRTKVRLQVEHFSIIGGILNGSKTMTTSPWTSTGSGGAPPEITRLISNLALENSYQWRARFLYSGAAAPPQLASRWFSTGAPGRQADARYARYRQVINFGPIADRLLSESPFSASAGATSGLAVSFASTTPSVCTVTPGGTVTLLATGVCTLVASQAGNSEYAPAKATSLRPLSRSFQVTSPAKQSQTISFAALPDRLTTDPAFALSATASSGLPVSFSVMQGSVCSLNGAMVTPSPSGVAGSCAIIASQAGNSQFNPAPAVSRVFEVAAPPKQSQTISFAALPNKLTTDPPFQVSATASSGLAVTFTAEGVCAVAGSSVTLSGAPGDCTVTAGQAGDAQFHPAPAVSRTFAVSPPAKLDQSIVFDPLPDRLVSDPPFELSATASSGLPVTLSAQGVCEVAGATVTLTASGTCTITAAQAGDSTYNPAPEVARSFAVSEPAKQSQTISFVALPDRLTTDPPFALAATASSGLPVSYAAEGVCAVSGGQVTLSGAEGVCVIRATQDGDAQFNPASPVERSFNVAATLRQVQTISFAPLPDRLTTAPPFALSATASSGLPVSFTAFGACAASGSTLTLEGVSGSCTVTASQDGDAQFNPAPQVSRSFIISDPAKQGQTISFAALPDRRTTDSPFTLSATASSGLAVSYSAVGACSVAGATLTLQGAGTCTVTASQAGDASFNPAPPVSRSFTVRTGYRLYLPLLRR